MIIFKDEDLNENWNLMELNDLLESQKAGCWGKESDEIDGTTVLRSTNYTKNFKLKLDDVAFREISKKDIENKKLEYMDILLEKSGGGPSQPVGRVILFDLIENRDYVCGNFIQLLRADKKVVYPKYLYYWLVLIHRKGFTNLLQNQTTGIRNLRLKDYLKLQVPLPPLKTQQKIVEILEKAEKLKEWRAEADVLIDEYLKSVFLEMFGDPVKNPKGWEILSLSDLGNWKSGGTPSRKDKTFFMGDVPWYTSGELNSMYISNSIERITEKAIENSNAKLIKPNSLLLGMYDTAALKSSITTVPSSCNQAIAYSELEYENSNIIYVYFAIQIGRKFFRKRQRGIRQKNLNLSMIKDTKIPSPPLDLQNHFAEIVQKVEQLKHHQNQSKQEMDNLFNVLMQKAFKGELTC